MTEMTEIQIRNWLPVAVGDALHVGAAMKILIGGGTRLSDADQARLSGMSPYLWKSNRDKVLGLVRELER